MHNTTNLTGKAAVFARGFMEDFWAKMQAHNYDKGELVISLRECQEAGAAAVADLGDEISVAYISKLARSMVKDRVVEKTKKGRRYFLDHTDETELFMDWLKENPKWGVDINPDAMDEIAQRTELIRFMKEYRGVVIHSERQLPKAQYNFLMKKFNEGKLKMCFVYDQDYVFLSDRPDMGAWDRIWEMDEEAANRVA